MFTVGEEEPLQTVQSKPRAVRYPFVASAELVNFQSSAELRAETADLSVFGCHVSSANLWPIGTKIRIRIVHNGARFAAFARIAHARPDLGMGIVFTKVEPLDQVVLDAWLANLRLGQP